MRLCTREGCNNQLRDTNQRQAMFCSLECKLLGYRHGEATRQKMSEKKLGKKQTPEIILKRTLHLRKTIDGMKTCPLCKRILPATLEYFYKRLSRYDGVSSFCKECQKKYQREQNKKHTNRICKHREENRDKRNMQAKDWKQRHPEKIKQYNLDKKVKMDALNQEITWVQCARSGCSMFLTMSQILLNGQLCSLSCKTIEENKKRRSQIESQKCQNPDCDNWISRENLIRKDRITIFCSKKCATTYRNGNVQYNPLGCKWFKEFDESHNTNGKYATNGGEYFIPKLGYFVDYFNSDLNLIMEWDEDHHYLKNGELKPKDIIRQEQIQKYYPNYQFTRIRENKFS